MFEPVFQREFDFALPIIGGIAQMALVLTFKISEQICWLAPIGVVGLILAAKIKSALALFD